MSKKLTKKNLKPVSGGRQAGVIIPEISAPIPGISQELEKEVAYTKSSRRPKVVRAVK